MLAANESESRARSWAVHLLWLTYHGFSGDCRAKRRPRPLQAAVGRRLARSVPRYELGGVPSHPALGGGSAICPTALPRLRSCCAACLVDHSKPTTMTKSADKGSCGNDRASQEQRHKNAQVSRTSRQPRTDEITHECRARRRAERHYGHAISPTNAVFDASPGAERDCHQAIDIGQDDCPHGSSAQNSEDRVHRVRPVIMERPARVTRSWVTAVAQGCSHCLECPTAAASPLLGTPEQEQAEREDRHRAGARARRLRLGHRRCAVPTRVPSARQLPTNRDHEGGESRSSNISMINRRKPPTSPADSFTPDFRKRAQSSE